MLLRIIRSRLLGLVVATVFPFFAVICIGLWSQLRDDQNRALERALDEARLLAIQVDDHIGSLENLLTGLSRAVSTRLADADANNALLRQVKEELPDYISNILLFAPDGSNIGISWNSDRRFYAGDRAYFQQVIAGQRLAIGDVIRTKLTGEWVAPVKDHTGRLRAVIAIGTKLDRFQDALRTQTLPAGSTVRIVKKKELSSHKATTAKTGIAIAPTDGTTVDELLANADLALYQAKSNGGRTRRFFLPVHRAQVQARRALDLELTRAYAQKELEIYFQPEIRLIDGAVVGAESLLRWRHPERGILMPGTFIDTLATNDVALDVGRWIILTACQKAASWRAMGLSPGRIGINVFPPQFQGDLLLKAIDDALRETNLPPESIELEITENSTLNYKGAAETLQKLHEKRVSIAFDDFGTGYASLSYLTRFPLSKNRS